jgi:hypothetical protein
LDDQIKEAEVGGACSALGETEYKNVNGKPEGKSLLGKHRRRWENNKVKLSHYTPWRHMGEEEV